MENKTELIYTFVWIRELPRSSSMMSRKKKYVRDFQDRLFSSGSNIKELIFTPPSGRGLVIPILSVFITPPSGRGLVIPFFFRGFFLVVTCPRPPVFARPKKYSSCLLLHSQELLS